MPHGARMARLGRIVAAGFPHHVIQRGNRRRTVFFEPSDYALYRDLLAERCHKASVEVWAYCLMPNHVHLVLTPSTPEGLARAIGETHRRYTRFVNARARWTGHLFQDRFASAALDDAHLVAAARYVALNPVRARLVARAEDWAWSSARAHLGERDDVLVRVAPLLDRVGRFCDLIDSDGDREAFAALHAARTTGRALGSSEFVAALERGKDIFEMKPIILGGSPTDPENKWP
jgi:putative transposase